MIQRSTLSFLKDLRKNNNKPWFDKNKPRYEEAKKNFEDVVTSYLTRLTAIDKRYAPVTAKNCVFRIYRDVRFSTDKTPYKSHFGAGISPNGKKVNEPGYYLHIEAGKSFLAGGIWMPEPDLLKKIRQEIDYNGKKFKKILTDSKFKKYYGALDEEYKLSRPPKGYDKTHPDIELLKFNSYIVWHQFSDKDATSASFVKELDKGARIMKPFLDFLGEAIS
ncbi:MAG TPA: DUF2461 domain-containing protein [Bacteroidia bacterium]|nr:DUF2461 domain-containing protein [Bacteroidia bacterium]